MKKIREIILIDEEKCNGCGQCVPSCAEGALEIVNGKARLVAERYCDGLGACLGHCPTGALTIEQRESDPFDEHAVEELLASQQPATAREEMACGCPSSMSAVFTPRSRSATETERTSALSHWPVKIILANPHASFLENADLLIAADCAAVAAPDLHDSHLPGKVVLIGCPKFGDTAQVEEKLSDIFAGNALSSIQVLRMEVPCCRNLEQIVQNAQRRAGTDFPIRFLVLSREGRLVESETELKPLPLG